MDLDQETGDISFNWYDTDGDPTNNSVHFFGSILLGSEIDEIRGTKECKKSLKFSTIKNTVSKRERLEGFYNVATRDIM